MKNLILDIKYYLLFLIIVLFIFFLYLKKNENFTEKYSPEIISDESFREKVELINLVSSERYSGALLKKIKVQKNDTLIKLLEKNGVSKIYIKAIIKTKGSEKLAAIKTGDFIEIAFSENKIPKEIFVTRNGLSGVLAELKEKSFKIIKHERSPEIIERFASVVIDESLYQSALKENIPDSVIMDLVYIFGWDIDFIFDIRSGDSFEILYEEYFFKGEKIKNGDIKAARFKRGKNIFSAIRFFSKTSGKKEYFSTRGENVKKAFLRTPVDFTYISSRYNLNRKHPVLNKIRAHTGVDYAAPTGTPVRSTSSGTVSFIGNKGGYGKLIEIKHSEEYSTRYAHLSKFNSRLKNGSKVEQGETIGYVGKTGLATGPHLHYEFRVSGNHTNPLTVKLPDAKPISKIEKKDFLDHAIKMINRLDDLYLKFNAQI
jgi:murein DD-endopeptidase MepM/ murein hydrolase activator NlpD